MWCEVLLWVDVQGMQAQAVLTLLKISMSPHMRRKRMVISTNHHHHHHLLSWQGKSLADMSPLVHTPHPPIIIRVTAAMEMVPVVFQPVHTGLHNLLVWLPVRQIQQGLGAQQTELRSNSRAAVPPSLQAAAPAMELINQRKQDHGIRPDRAVVQGMIRPQLLAEVVAARRVGKRPWQRWLHPHPHATIAMALVLTAAAQGWHRRKDTQASISLMRMRLLGRYMMKQMQMVPQLRQRTHSTGMILLYCKLSVGVHA